MQAARTLLPLAVAALALAAVVRAHPGPLPGEAGLTLAWQELVRPHPFPTAVIGAVSTFNFPRPARIMIVAVVVVLALSRRWLDIALALGALWAAGKTNHQISQWVQRPRPAGHGIFVNRDISDVYSFPSGHVNHALVFLGLILFLSFQLRRPAPWLLPVLWLVRIVLFAEIVLMAPSRVLEGEHWPSDVAAGLLVGGFWLLVGIQVYTLVTRRWPRLVPSNERRGVPGVA
jgi:membrane-associated phospholipid phosphatase